MGPHEGQQPPGEFEQIGRKIDEIVTHERSMLSRVAEARRETNRATAENARTPHPLRDHFAGVIRDGGLGVGDAVQTTEPTKGYDPAPAQESSPSINKRPKLYAAIAANERIKQYEAKIRQLQELRAFVEAMQPPHALDRLLSDMIRRTFRTPTLCEEND